MGRMFALFTLAVTAALGIGTPAGAQDVAPSCRLCPAAPSNDTDRPATPLRLDVQTTLDFDRLVVAGNGSGRAEIRPDGGRNASGAVSAMGARSMVGQVVIRGEPGRLVRIELPQSIILYGTAGGTIRVESVQSDLPAMPKLDSNGMLQFRFGGILEVEAGLDGEFRGDVRIDVDYF